MFENRNIFVDVLAILFGISAWVSINGLWVELPLLVQRLPEGWNLASYLAVIIQIANLGPISYSLCRKWLGDGRQKWIIYGLLTVGIAASVALALHWNETTVIMNVEHSTVLFILVFFLSLVDCTSSVLFLPYMAVFRDVYLNSYFIGEGLSGFLPSTVALIQGVGGNPTCQNVTTDDGTWIVEPVTPDPRFSVQVFFFLLAGMMLISGLAFLLLNTLTYFKQEYAIINQNDEEEEGDVYVFNSEELTSAEESSNNKRKLVVLLSMQAYVCFISNGALPSIQTYSCLPYGNTVYHLSVTLNSMTNPLMAFLTSFIPCKNVSKLVLITVIGSGFSSILLATALNSPNMLWGQSVGGTITVLSWIIYGGLFSYVKVAIAGICRSMSNSTLFWCGAVTQLGSALGALLMFVLVNVYHVFHGYYIQC